MEFDANAMDLIEQISQSIFIENLLAMGIYTGLIAGVILLISIKTFGQGYGQRSGEIEAEAKKLDQILEKVGAIQEMTEEYQQIYAVKSERRARLEELIELMYAQLEVIKEIYYELLSDSPSPNKATEIELRLSEGRSRICTLAYMYFPRLSPATSTVMAVMKNSFFAAATPIHEAPEGKIDIETNISGCNFAALGFIALALRTYSEECGIEQDDMPDVSAEGFRRSIIMKFKDLCDEDDVKAAVEASQQ